jgi:hypothetical protein
MVPVGKIDHFKPGAHGLDGSLHGHNASGALCRYIQIVGDGPRGHLQHLNNRLQMKNEKKITSQKRIQKFYSCDTYFYLLFLKLYR